MIAALNALPCSFERVPRSGLRVPGSRRSGGGCSWPKRLSLENPPTPPAGSVNIAGGKLVPLGRRH
jgi:hypothetical protein